VLYTAGILPRHQVAIMSREFIIARLGHTKAKSQQLAHLSHHLSYNDPKETI
jgi:hypothetical protein